MRTPARLVAARRAWRSDAPPSSGARAPPRKLAAAGAVRMPSAGVAGAKKALAPPKRPRSSRAARIPARPTASCHKDKRPCEKSGSVTSRLPEFQVPPEFRISVGSQTLTRPWLWFSVKARACTQERTLVGAARGARASSGRCWRGWRRASIWRCCFIPPPRKRAARVPASPGLRLAIRANCGSLCRRGSNMLQRERPSGRPASTQCRIAGRAPRAGGVRARWGGRCGR